MQKPLFREEAMDKMFSPDELDRLMCITDPKGWLALVAATVVWGVFSSVPIEVGGDKGVQLGGDLRSQVASNPGWSPRSRWTRPGKRRAWQGVSFRAEHTRN
jgi:hypothetical protein